MCKLQKGILYISNEDIKELMRLAEDTHFEYMLTDQGVEIRVVASSKNEHDWLTEDASNWNLRRKKIALK